MHYITNEWELGKVVSVSMFHNTLNAIYLEELLIDFCELIREHSSTNLAPTVYETLSFFGLKGQVSWSVCFIYVPTELLV